MIYEDVTGGFFALKDTQINNDLSGRFSKYFNVFNIQENLTLQARLYLGSILFGKFIPPKYHPKGGINHVEYRLGNETIVNSSLYESRKIFRIDTENYKLRTRLTFNPKKNRLDKTYK